MAVEVLAVEGALGENRFCALPNFSGANRNSENPKETAASSPEDVGGSTASLLTSDV